MNATSEKTLDGYKFNGSRSNLANINAYSACLHYLGKPYAHTPWLYGAIGIPFLFRVGGNVNYAPILNELPHDRIVELLRNLGVHTDGFCRTAEHEELERLREEAWNAVKRNIDAGIPCFGRGFYFDFGETSAVQGYDESTGEYIISCWHGTKRLHRQSLGERDGLVDLHWMTAAGTEEDDRRTVRDALRLAVEFAEGKWTGPHTRVASAAYDYWVGELRSGNVDGWYFAYHTHEWDTCRTNGYKFLEEAKRRLSAETPRSLDDAIEAFAKVRDTIHRVYELFPWEQPRGLIEDTERRLEAARLLEEARAYDEASIDTFRRVVRELDGQ